MMDKLQYIRDNINCADQIGQLAEEAVELAHAALKLERVVRGTNPTPVTQIQATAKLCEEVADVLNTLEVLKIWPGTESIKVIRDVKMDRWVDRIEEKGGIADENVS